VLMDRLDPDSHRLETVREDLRDRHWALRLARRVVRGQPARRLTIVAAISAGLVLHAVRMDRAALSAFSLVWDLTYTQALREATSVASSGAGILAAPVAGRMESRPRHLARMAHGRPVVWLVGGTRPEALKLAPLIAALERQHLIRPVVVATGQHPSMFHTGLATFGLRPDRELRPRRDDGSQAELMSHLAEHLDRELTLDLPAAMVVQGDTSSALIGALTAFWRQVPVVHLEAGLRSHDLSAPFPEEANRKMIDQIAALHLAPTPGAAANLLAEGIASERIEVIGNTVVDALLAMTGRAQSFADPALEAVEAALASGHRLLLVTVHRRESWGEPLRSVLHAVRDILREHPDTIAVLPAHPNPVVRADVTSILGDEHRAVITQPLDYPDLVRLLERSVLVLSDSGGIQEEAPTFGVPVLVMRDRTERVEAVETGCSFLVGTSRARIVAMANRWLASDADHDGPVGHRNPFGDGLAGERAAVAIARLLGLPADPVAPFVQSDAHAAVSAEGTAAHVIPTTTE
jgi:UDP-N-acetylglucosamine 2-epimerase (non-hydrolysing)